MIIVSYVCYYISPRARASQDLGQKGVLKVPKVKCPPISQSVRINAHGQRTLPGSHRTGTAFGETECYAPGQRTANLSGQMELSSGRASCERGVLFFFWPGCCSAGGPGVRIESCLYSGYSVPPYYDSLIAKLIVHGDDRAHCLARLKRALEEFVVEPIPTTLPLHQRLVEAPAIKDGSYDIRWLEEVFLTETVNQ